MGLREKKEAIVAIRTQLDHIQIPDLPTIYNPPVK